MENYKIATLNKISEAGLSELTDNYTITENLNEANGIIVRSADMKSMDFSENLLGIARAGVGVNNIPFEKCAEKGIVVFNTPGANANAVKELVICSMIAGSRNLVAASNWASSLTGDVADEVEKGKSQFKGSEIKGKTLGVIGLGTIGGLVANAAVHMGMKVIGYDAHLSVKSALNLSKHAYVVEDMEDMLPECDYLTVHVHANSETNGMINDEVFDRLKRGCMVMNFSRGTIVDIPALKKALEYGMVSKYITDFPSEELIGTDHVILTPHLGASTDDAEDNCADMAVTELMNYIENGNIRNSVNFPDVDMGKCRSAARISVLHSNIPNMISSITGTLSAYNISNFTNRSQGAFAYSLLDLDAAVPDDALNSLRSLDGVIKLRVL